MSRYFIEVLKEVIFPSGCFIGSKKDFPALDLSKIEPTSVLIKWKSHYVDILYLQLIPKKSRGIFRDHYAAPLTKATGVLHFTISQYWQIRVRQWCLLILKVYWHSLDISSFPICWAAVLLKTAWNGSYERKHGTKVAYMHRAAIGILRKCWEGLFTNTSPLAGIPWADQEPWPGTSYWKRMIPVIIDRMDNYWRWHIRFECGFWRILKQGLPNILQPRHI